jgi:hypothetical protein
MSQRERALLAWARRKQCQRTLEGDRMTPRWYTVEYDENSIAWLSVDDQDRVCLVPGMQVEVTALAIRRPIGGKPITAGTPTRPPRTPRKKRVT